MTKEEFFRKFEDPENRRCFYSQDMEEKWQWVEKHTKEEVERERGNKCLKTLSGEHLWEEGEIQEFGGSVSGYSSQFVKYDHPICSLCGIVNDSFSHQVNSKQSK